MSITINHVISNSNLMSEGDWDKLSECIFENFEIVRVKQKQFQNFQKSSEPNMWLLVNYIKPTNTLYWN